MPGSRCSGLGLCSPAPGGVGTKHKPVFHGHPPDGPPSALICRNFSDVCCRARLLIFPRAGSPVGRFIGSLLYVSLAVNYTSRYVIFWGPLFFINCSQPEPGGSGDTEAGGMWQTHTLSVIKQVSSPEENRLKIAREVHVSFVTRAPSSIRSCEQQRSCHCFPQRHPTAPGGSQWQTLLCPLLSWRILAALASSESMAGKA